MKIAVTSETPQGLASPLSHHFGRCPYYTLITVENGTITTVEAVPNPGAGGHNPGDLPEFIRRQQVDVLLSGGMGPRAVSFFRQMGVEVVTGASGTVEEALRRYLAGDLSGYTPCQEHGEGHHHGH